MTFCRTCSLFSKLEEVTAVRSCERTDQVHISMFHVAESPLKPWENRGKLVRNIPLNPGCKTLGVTYPICNPWCWYTKTYKTG